MKKSLRSLLLTMTSIGAALVPAHPAGADVSTPGSTAETVPAAPSDLRANYRFPNRIAVTWLDNSDNETGFVVERGRGFGCTTFTEIARVDAGVSTFDDGRVVRGSASCYRVRAVNAAGASAFSNTGAVYVPPR
jgi:titin